jgi:hypothetical protein
MGIQTTEFCRIAKKTRPRRAIDAEIHGSVFRHSPACAPFLPLQLIVLIQTQDQTTMDCVVIYRDKVDLTDLGNLSNLNLADR